jgi:hypothetical protein
VAHLVNEHEQRKRHDYPEDIRQNLDHGNAEQAAG